MILAVKKASAVVTAKHWWESLTQPEAEYPSIKTKTCYFQGFMEPPTGSPSWELGGTIAMATRWDPQGA